MNSANPNANQAPAAVDEIKVEIAAADPAPQVNPGGIQKPATNNAKKAEAAPAAGGAKEKG